MLESASWRLTGSRLPGSALASGRLAGSPVESWRLAALAGSRHSDTEPGSTPGSSNVIVTSAGASDKVLWDLDDDLDDDVTSSFKSTPASSA